MEHLGDMGLWRCGSNYMAALLRNRLVHRYQEFKLTITSD